MKPIACSLCLLLIVLQTSCRTVPSSGGRDDGKIEVVFVQVNDVYEITPLAGGKQGGMARVATLRKQVQQANPNTFLVMAGDFVSPSVFNSLQYEGKAVRGAQMIEAMNAAGMDFAVLGNHEFDIKEAELQDRINESRFQWIATNAFHKRGAEITPFRKTKPTSEAFPKWHIQTVRDGDGTTARIAIIGLTLPSNPAEYVHYTDALAEAKAAYTLLKDSADAVIALTHQTVAEDVQLAKEVPGLALILGGHEHDQQFEKVGKTYVTKAHSNAQSAYVVKMFINTRKNKVKVAPQLKYLNESVPLDSATNVVVQKWIGIGEKNFGSLGFDASTVILSTGEPLEGRETQIRHKSTNLTRLVVSAMEAAAPEADLAMFNSGSVRVDDILQLPVTQYDIIRAMPFGGGIREIEMKGRLLEKVLTAGVKNKGNGGFLQYSAALAHNEATGRWSLGGKPIEPEQIYRVALSDFLLTGKETGLGFLNEKNEDVTKVYPATTEQAVPLGDIRLAVVRYAQKK